MTLLTLTEAGRRLGVHRSTVRAWIDRGVFPSVETSPGRFRVPEEAVRFEEQGMALAAHIARDKGYFDSASPSRTEAS